MPVHRHWIAVLVGAALVGGSCLMMGLTLGTEPAYLTHWLPWGLLGGLGIGCVVTGISSIATNALPAEQFAAGTGMLMTSRQFGGAIGVAGLAAILQAHGLLSPDGFYLGFSWCGIVILLAAASAVGLRVGTRRPGGSRRREN
jgi:MFS family permease